MGERCIDLGWITNNKLDKNEQNMILDIHNKLRSDVALGNRICTKKIVLRTANRMFNLVSSVINMCISGRNFKMWSQVSIQICFKQHLIQLVHILAIV